MNPTRYFSPKYWAVNYFATRPSEALPGNHYVWVGTGGIKFGGSATVEYRPVEVYEWVASGGIGFGGSATTEFEPAAQIYEWIGTGGIKLGGSATTEFFLVRTWLGTGGIKFGGSATTEYVPGLIHNTYEWTGTGGIVLGGQATYSLWLAKFFAARSRNFTYYAGYRVFDYKSQKETIFYPLYDYHEYVAAGGSLTFTPVPTIFTPPARSFNFYASYRSFRFVSMKPAVFYGEMKAFGPLTAEERTHTFSDDGHNETSQ